MTPEQYALMHQKSFRCAFDYLNAHFPPGNDPAWWEQAAKELSAASVEAGENELVIELLNAVYTYLGFEYDRRKKENVTDN